MSQIVLCVLAHPDDAEFLCGGTLIRLRREHGWDVHLATMTAGDCGSAEHSAEEISRLRRAEGAASAAVIGGTFHCIGERDLLVTYSEPAITKVTHLMRRVRPAVVLTHSPDDYHLDHEMTSKIVRGAAFAAPISLFQPGESPPIDRIPHLYYCDPVEGKDALGREEVPGFCIDIGATIETKAEMLARHATQRNWLLKHHGMDHYIDSMMAWGAYRGKEHGVAYAEGFRQHLGHSYPQDNILSQLLGWV